MIRESNDRLVLERREKISAVHEDEVGNRTNAGKGRAGTAVGWGWVHESRNVPGPVGSL